MLCTMTTVLKRHSQSDENTTDSKFKDTHLLAAAIKSCFIKGFPINEVASSYHQMVSVFTSQIEWLLFYFKKFWYIVFTIRTYIERLQTLRSCCYIFRSTKAVKAFTSSTVHWYCNRWDVHKGGLSFWQINWHINWVCRFRRG